MNEIQLEILEFSYWEHFKAAKDLALIYPIGHHKRISLEKEIDKLVTTLQQHKNETTQPKQP